MNKKILFGKFNGMSVSEVVKNENYVKWAMEKIADRLKTEGVYKQFRAAYEAFGYKIEEKKDEDDEVVSEDEKKEKTKKSKKSTKTIVREKEPIKESTLSYVLTNNSRYILYDVTEEQLEKIKKLFE
jgi:argininosuccinate lyase